MGRHHLLCRERRDLDTRASRAPVSVVYPLLSIGYIVNAIAAAALFQESLAPGKLLGIAVIILGVFILTQSHA